MNELHHAIAFEGDREAALVVARSYVQDVLALHELGNPDVQVLLFDQLVIDDANRLRQRAMLAPVGPRQVFVLAFDRVTGDAQNALLKLLEEPTHGTHFALVVPTVEILLPTVRSRIAYGGRATGISEADMLAEKFLAGSTEERLSLISPFYKNIKDDEKLAVRTKARAMVYALEHRLHESGIRTHDKQLREVAFVENYVGDASASLKMLLEHLAYTL